MNAPGHLDADANGMVTLSNVNIAFEMVDLITATRASEANLSVVKNSRQMALKTLEIGRKSPRPALAVAFLSLLESAFSAKSLAARAGDSIDIPQQIISLGVANAANALGGGMPASGSITRSCLNWSTGAQNPAASLFSGVLLLGGIFAFGPLVGFVPQAALSAIVVAVGLG